MVDWKSYINEDGVAIIPEGVTKIDARAFADCFNLKEVYLPEGVTKIGRHAFAGCANLKKVHLQKRLKKIHPSAFTDCTNLKSIRLDNATVMCFTYGKKDVVI